MTPKISVIMTTYNTKEEYLRESVESIFAQSYENFELIIIDDGSTNNTKDIIKSYDDWRITYHYQTNKGISAARNLGTKLAQGEYIAVMDSDDIALPDRLKKEIEFLESHPDYSLVGSWFEQFPSKKIGKMMQEPKILDFLHTCWLMHSSVMFRKKDFEKYSLFYNENLNCAIDYDLWCRAIRFLRFYNLQEILVKYRVEGQGIATKRRDERVKNTIQIQQGILDYLTSDCRLQKKIINTVYFDQKIDKSFCEQIFSVKNSLKFNKKYKVITILGFELKLLVKEYK